MFSLKGTNTEEREAAFQNRDLKMKTFKIAALKYIRNVKYYATLAQRKFQ